MNRPSVSKSTLRGYVTIRVPNYTVDRLLVEIAKHLANSDDAIRHAVDLAREAEAGGVTDATLEQFRYAVGVFGGTYVSLDNREAKAFLAELTTAIETEIVEAASDVPAYVVTTTTTNSSAVTS